MDHPILNSKRSIYLYLATWALVASVHVVVLTLHQKLPLQWVLIDSLTFTAFYCLLGLAFWYSTKVVTIDRLRWPKVLEHHLFASAFTSVLWLGVSYLFLSEVFAVEADYLAFLRNSIVWRGLIGVLFYFLIVSFYYVYIFSENYRRQLIKESKLEMLVKEAELRSLKFQINPHFIFNSLNSINALTMTDPQKAGEMTIKLGDYLRYTLSSSERQKNTMQEELDSLKLYLDIEKVRFGDKLGFTQHVESTCMSKRVPSMIFQPLIENAIKHGVYESLKPVDIKFKCQQNGNFLKITVENNFDPDAVTSNREGIGISNVRNRLQMMYNHVNLLDIEKEEDRFRVNMFIPVEEN